MWRDGQVLVAVGFPSWIGFALFAALPDSHAEAGAAACVRWAGRFRTLLLMEVSFVVVGHGGGGRPFAHMAALDPFQQSGRAQLRP
jgi:hypothetical protein